MRYEVELQHAPGALKVILQVRRHNAVRAAELNVWAMDSKGVPEGTLQDIATTVSARIYEALLLYVGEQGSLRL